MTTEWVIQDNGLDPVQMGQIKDTLRFTDVPFHRVEIHHFSDDIIPITGLPKGTKVIPYGSYKLNRLARDMGWEGLFYDDETFRVNTWMDNRDDMLNTDSEFYTVKELQSVLSRRPQEEVYFIRPVEDLKAFNGTVTRVHEILRWMQNVDSGEFAFPEDTPIAISSPKHILAEWRWIIIGGEVISGSTYRWRGQKLVSNERDTLVIHEAQELANKWLPHETVAMDVALTPQGPKVLEFNCFNSAGLYYHDIKKIVRVATNYVDNL